MNNLAALTPGTRIELTRSYGIREPKEWNFIINHLGERKKNPPTWVKSGTCGVIEKHVVLYSYSVMFTIRLCATEFACIRLLCDSKDFKLPDARVYDMNEYIHLMRKD